MATTDDATTTPMSTLRRRNSIETPSTLTLPISTTTTRSTTITSTSSSLADYELISLKPASYTSLRDILPSPAFVVQSPKPPSFAVHSGYEISIRNRLVKQAAWAYLQPMSTSPDSHGSTIFHRLWNRITDVFIRLVNEFCDCLFRSVHITTSTTSRL